MPALASIEEAVGFLDVLLKSEQEKLTKEFNTNKTKYIKYP